MAVCSTTALRKYLTQRSNLGQPLREKAVSTTRGHAEGETLITSGAYRRPLFKSSQSAGRRSVKRYDRRPEHSTATTARKLLINLTFMSDGHFAHVRGHRARMCAKERSTSSA